MIPDIAGTVPVLHLIKMLALMKETERRVYAWKHLCLELCVLLQNICIYVNICLIILSGVMKESSIYEKRN